MPPGAGDSARSAGDPWWRRALRGLGVSAAFAVQPLRRLWKSDDPLDGYALVHLGSAIGDTLVAIALADSIFFSIPVGQAEGRVAAYLLLTMAPLAVAGPLLVPLLDRAGPRRAISVASAAGRAFLALYLAPRTGTAYVFPAVFLVLVLSRVYAVTKNGLVLAYVGSDEGLVRANARLGRFTALAALLAAPIGIAFLKVGGPAAPIYLATGAYAVTALLNLRLPPPRIPRARPRPQPIAARGRIPELATPAFGAVALRMASGFLLFLLAFALRRDGEPAYWFGVLVGAGLVGALLADLAAPKLPQGVREDILVVASLLVAGIGAFLAFEAFGLPQLAAFCLVVGTATELGRLAFQSLLQQHAPAGALGRVFVRYEVMFQLAWVLGAVLPALFPVGFQQGILILGAFYVAVGISYLVWHRIERRKPTAATPGPATADPGAGDPADRRPAERDGERPGPA